MVEFNLEWYEKFLGGTNEKDLLVSKIASFVEGKPHESCLEIGLGISPYFASKLSKYFKRYAIVEKRLIKENIPKPIELINEDWEDLKINEKFDVIIASHVIYYFKDKKKAVEKMFSCLKKDGRIFFVVNGKESDYGPLKSAFSEMVKEKYKFTYDELMTLLKNKKIREYTLPSSVYFSTYEDLFETLRISFDNYPNEYQRLKDKIISYFKENIKGNKFVIDQKIIEVSK